MMQAYLPNKNIALAVGRTLLTGQSRWAWVAIVSVAALLIIGGGNAMGGGLKEFLKSAAGLLVLTLHFLWIWLAVRLLALNDPTAARLVPQYVQQLRITALWIWLFVLAVTVVLDAANGGGLLWAATGSASLMVFLIAPFRWPLRWCIVIFGVAFLARQNTDIAVELFKFIIAWSHLLAWCCIGVCALIVMFLFHPNGSNYGKIFSSQLGGTVSTDASLAQPKLADFGVWGLRALQLGRWFTLPFAIYARKLLQRKMSNDRHSLARVELGFGPTPHWLTQVELLMALLFGMAIFSAADVILFADFIAGGVLVIAVLPLLSWPELLRKTTVEQKLMLLLPSMSRGNVLTRQLVRRQLVQGYVSWGVAAAIGFWLPLEHVKLAIAISGYLAILILIPWLPTINWAELRPLGAARGLLGLAYLAAVGGGFFAVQHWKLMPIPLLFATALAISMASLNWRWNKVKRYPQAFPAGYLLAHEAQS